MILPTVITITMDAINAVPHEYREGALALGATPMHTLFSVVLPAAKKTILAGVVLGMGRAIGETMAVMLVSGNRPTMPGSVLDPIRTMTSNIALEMSYASGLHQEALFATGVILFIFIMAINLGLRICLLYTSPLFGVAVADGEAVGSIWEIWPLRPEKARMPMEMPTAKHSTAMHTCIQILL